jgi:3-hydroxyisobutyrate dehydrogenase-like beta-hydroxyacid dehydrogenase
MESEVQVGFIGLGRMGEVMARRLVDAGHEVTVYNRTASKLASLTAAGAKAAPSVGDAARSTGLVMTMLSDDAALASVGAELAQALPAGGVHVAMGTHSVAAVRALAQTHAALGQHLISAPVLGRPEAVAAGRATIVAAGPEGAIGRCAPLFEAIGRRTFAAGAEPSGAAAVKVANNFLLACAIEALGEAFSLVEKSGVDPTVFHEVVTDGLFACPAYTTYAGMIVNKAYDPPGFTARLGLKDINLTLAAGEAAQAPLPSANIVRDRLLGAIANGDGDRDWIVMTLEQRRASGLA